MKTLMINEIFYSIQGESTWVGKPCVFVRLTGCHLRCRYCDTEYAFHEGQRWSIDDIVDEVDRISGPNRCCELVEVTGGEPLLQAPVHDLMRCLCDRGKTVLLETSGACDISACDPRVIRIMDLKSPASGEGQRNLWSNLVHLGPRDEVKFVLCCRADYEWARDLIRRHELQKKVHAVLMSAVHEVGPGDQLPGVAGLPQRDLAQWLLADRLPVRLQSQLHKLIWGPTTRGV